MASEQPPLNLIRAPTAIDELHGIWQWNADYYSVSHADHYLRYLQDSILELASTYAKGKVVVVRPDLRYVIIRRRNKGHGHVVVYKIDENAVRILHVFHTAQDGQNMLADELG